ncbi:MAG TPA: hypothetical protein VKA85_10030 [Candidatus Limnocylindrales bacterium]|nr:hypothetical protein [Candidatus Limnocylindrales bacterium]
MTAPDRRRRGEPNAGAFMGPDVMIPTPMGALGASPAHSEPGSDDEPPPRRKGATERILDRFRRFAGR